MARLVWDKSPPEICYHFELHDTRTREIDALALRQPSAMGIRSGKQEKDMIFNFNDRLSSHKITNKPHVSHVPQVPQVSQVTHVTHVPHVPQVPQGPHVLLQLDQLPRGHDLSINSKSHKVNELAIPQKLLCVLSG